MTESYFLSVIMNVFKHIGTTDREVFINGRNSVVPKVYGRMSTEVSPRIIAVVNYSKGVVIMKGRVIINEILFLFDML